MELNTRQKIWSAANVMRMFWKQVSDPDPWKNLKERQAYRDCLEAMKSAGLLQDYSLEEVIVHEKIKP